MLLRVTSSCEVPELIPESIIPIHCTYAIHTNPCSRPKCTFRVPLRWLRSDLYQNSHITFFFSSQPVSVILLINLSTRVRYNKMIIPPWKAAGKPPRTRVRESKKEGNKKKTEKVYAFPFLRAARLLFAPYHPYPANKLRISLPPPTIVYYIRLFLLLFFFFFFPFSAAWY